MPSSHSISPRRRKAQGRAAAADASTHECAASPSPSATSAAPPAVAPTSRTLSRSTCPANAAALSTEQSAPPHAGAQAQAPLGASHAPAGQEQFEGHRANSHCNEASVSQGVSPSDGRSQACAALRIRACRCPQRSEHTLSPRHCAPHAQRHPPAASTQRPLPWQPRSSRGHALPPPKPPARPRGAVPPSRRGPAQSHAASASSALPASSDASDCQSGWRSIARAQRAREAGSPSHARQHASASSGPACVHLRCALRRVVPAPRCPSRRSAREREARACESKPSLPTRPPLRPPRRNARFARLGGAKGLLSFLCTAPASRAARARGGRPLINKMPRCAEVHHYCASQDSARRAAARGLSAATASSLPGGARRTRAASLPAAGSANGGAKAPPRACDGACNLLPRARSCLARVCSSRARPTREARVRGATTPSMRPTALPGGGLRPPLARCSPPRGESSRTKARLPSQAPRGPRCNSPSRDQATAPGRWVRGRWAAVRG